MTAPLIDLGGLLAQLAQVPQEQLRPLAEALAPLLPEREPSRPESPWMTPEEAAVYLRTTRKAIYSRLDAGQFTRSGSPGRVLLDRAEVEAFARGDKPSTRAGRSDHVLTNLRAIRDNPRIQGDVRHRR
jgi:excisionase family DNA binding protein